MGGNHEVRIHVPHEVWKAIKVQCVMEELSIDCLLAKKLTEWYGGDNKQKKP